MSLVSVLASLVDPGRVLGCGIVWCVYIGVCRTGRAGLMLFRLVVGVGTHHTSVNDIQHITIYCLLHSSKLISGFTYEVWKACPCTTTKFLKFCLQEEWVPIPPPSPIFIVDNFFVSVIFLLFFLIFYIDYMAGGMWNWVLWSAVYWNEYKETTRTGEQG
jgi:hypothetical protein